MKAIIVAALLFLFFAASPVWATDSWDRTDIMLGAVALTATVVDWGQTRYIAKHPDQFRERNSSLGEHPGTGRIDTYFAGVMVGSAVIAHILPSHYRKWFLGSLAVLEIGVTMHNRNIGIKVSF